MKFIQRIIRNILFGIKYFFSSKEERKDMYNRLYWDLYNIKAKQAVNRFGDTVEYRTPNGWIYQGIIMSGRIKHPFQGRRERHLGGRVW